LDLRSFPTRRSSDLRAHRHGNRAAPRPDVPVGDLGLAAPQLNFLTLACADVERMANFLHALGWVEDGASEPAHRLFQGTNGIVVALYGASNYEPHFGPRTDGFRGFTLGLNLASPEEVDDVYESLQQVEG